MAERVLQPIGRQKVFFTFTLLMSCMVIPGMCYATGAFPKPFVLVPAVFDCYLLTVLADVLAGRKLRIILRPLYWLLWIAVILLLGGEVFSLLCYQSPYSMTVLQLILETNSREATEFLSGHGILGQLATAVAVTIAALMASLLTSPRGGKNKKTPSFPSGRGGWKRGLRGGLMAILLLSASCQAYSYLRLYQAYTADVTTTIAENKYMPLRNSPFVRFMYGHALNVVSTKELGKLTQTVRQTEIDGCSFRSPIILLLIGESYNKYHSPLYNPEARQTTPNLSQLQEQGNLIVYDNAVSPYNVTSKVFRHMFSTYYPGCGREWVDCTLFPAIFKKAGYRVWFLTNQFAGEENNKDHHDHAGGTIFNQRELRQLQFSSMNTEAYRYDMDLLSELPPIDTLAAQPSLLIFHMIGQHEDYGERYPAAYGHFTADSIRNPYTDEKGRQIVAEYENATLYNDAVVSELLKRYSSQDVVGIYLSDHGEEIYDWRNSCYRTNSDQMTPEIARYQYEIPLLFYVSDTFKSNHPELTDEILSSCHKPFFATMLPFVLFHLAGINHADYRASLDILSPEFDENYPRIIRENVYYDELMQQ